MYEESVGITVETYKEIIKSLEMLELPNDAIKSLKNAVVQIEENQWKDINKRAYQMSISDIAYQEIVKTLSNPLGYAGNIYCDSEITPEIWKNNYQYTKEELVRCCQEVLRSYFFEEKHWEGIMQCIQNVLQECQKKKIIYNDFDSSFFTTADIIY
ncbi:MAG: hypothetical protein HQK76_19055 [Desulfobacterales bacterium]|nr:hypothetical protein [Desulfobacterales bacterium]